MSRRRSEGGLDEAVNMDVMMDNMTDVVGTLLMVLIVVQLKVNSTINDIQSKLPEVTQQQVEAVQKELELQKKEFATATRKLAQPKATNIKPLINKRQDDVKHYETALAQTNVNLIDLAKLEKDLAEKRMQIEAEKTSISKLIDEREKLKGLLDDAKTVEIPPAKIVRMPAAREIPEGAELTRVLCAGNKLYLVDTALFRKMTLTAFNRTKQTLVQTKGPITPDNKDNNTYDHEKTVAFFNKRDLGNNEYELKFPLVKTSDRIRTEIRPKPSAGETPQQFAAPNSEFSRALRLLKRKPTGVVWFLVHPDSMETYLRAREQTDAAEVPAGWEMYGANFLTEVFHEFKVNQLEKPPPPNPDAINIPAPKKTID